MTYNAASMLTGIYKDGINNTKEIVAEYQYDESGNRLSVTDEAGNSTHYSYDAAGNIIATYDKISGQSATLQQIPVYAMGRIGTYDGNIYSYEVSDHLGNVRQAWTEAQLNSATATNPAKANYYPYGLEWQGGSLASYPYGYQGQFSEKDKEANISASDGTPLSNQQSFDLRDYNAITGLWDVVDPYNQYYSSYIGMGNNPVNGIDPDGGKFFDFFKNAWEKTKSVFKEKVDFDGGMLPEVDIVATRPAGNAVSGASGVNMGKGIVRKVAVSVYNALSNNIFQANTHQNIRLSNIAVTFDPGADRVVHPNLINYLNTLEPRLVELGVESINISSTSNHPSNANKSAHSVKNGSRAVDINYINGEHVSLTSAISDQVQITIKHTMGWRENYGPTIIEKMNRGSAIQAPWARKIKGGHYDHIHISVHK